MHHIYKINSLSISNLYSLNNIFKTQINYLLDFYKAHKIKKLSLEDSYQLTLTLLRSKDFELLKLISVLTYLKFNNSESELNSSISKLNFNKTSELVVLDIVDDFGDITGFHFYTRTLVNN